MNDTVLAMNQIAREKYWSELTPEEKVERLANDLAQTMRTCDQLRRKVEAFEHHGHVGNVVMLPIGTETGERHYEWLKNRLGR
jgi:bacterioferritin (cytochrome b1)